MANVNHLQPNLTLIHADLGRKEAGAEGELDQQPIHFSVQVFGQHVEEPALAPHNGQQSRVYIVAPRRPRRPSTLLWTIVSSLLLLAVWTLAIRQDKRFPSLIELGATVVASWLFMTFRAGRDMVAEKLTIIRGVGFQTETLLRNGSSSNHLFLPMSSIRSLFIHEVMTRWHFNFVLAVALCDAGRPIVLLFQGVDLRLWQLQALYNDILDSFSLDHGSTVPLNS